MDWIRKLFGPAPAYIVIKVYPDCEIRRNERAVWVHITNEMSYFARLKQKQVEILTEYRGYKNDGQSK